MTLKKTRIEKEKVEGSDTESGKENETEHGKDSCQQFRN